MFKNLRSWRIIAVFLALAAILAVRAATDHSRNFHYTGDHPSEVDLTIAMNNFGRFGYIETKFMPVIKEVPEGVTKLSPQTSGFYTHYGPAPYVLFSIPYLAFGYSEYAARLLVIAITMAGLVCALLAIRKILEALLPPEELASIPRAVLLVAIAFSPVFLCFGDTLYEQPLNEALKWAALLWAADALLGRVRLGLGALLCFSLIWVSFEWMVPMGMVVTYVLVCREGMPWRRLRPWLVICAGGFAASIGMRVLHNAWVLGGIHEFAKDITEIMANRSGLKAEAVTVPYSGGKHLAKLLLGTYWFVGAAPLIAILASRKEWAARMRDARSDCSSAQARMLGLLVIWGLGSFSWQILMRQHAMIHGFTYIHVAQFFLLIGAVSYGLLWRKSTWLVSACVLVQAIGFGGLIVSEVWIPAVQRAAAVITRQSCASERAEMSVLAGELQSSVSSLFREELAQAGPEPQACSPDARRMKLFKGLVYFLKASSYSRN